MPMNDVWLKRVKVIVKCFEVYFFDQISNQEVLYQGKALNILTALQALWSSVRLIITKYIAC